MEVSSHALDQDRVAGIGFHSAIFTNLTQDHLDYHHDLADYFQAKSRLFRNLSRGAFAVINNDDAYGRKLKKLTSAKIITYGIEKKSDLVATDLSLGIQGSGFILLSPEGKIKFNIALIGRHNVYNVLAVLAWARKAGWDMRLVKNALEKFSFVPGRLEKIAAGDFSVFVDYAHTEDALSNAISSLRQLGSGRVIVVFGCGGERDKSKRPKMGRVVSKLADFFIITNDNPRGEDPDQIIQDIKRGIHKNNYCLIPGRREAIKKSISLARAGDIILVAGKGHESCQILKDRTIPFDDCRVVKECLRSLKF